MKWPAVATPRLSIFSFGLENSLYRLGIQYIIIDFVDISDDKDDLNGLKFRVWNSLSNKNAVA